MRHRPEHDPPGYLLQLVGVANRAVDNFAQQRDRNAEHETGHEPQA